MRATRSHTGNRRSHHALKKRQPFSCPKCKEPALMHTACLNCGTYKGREVIDVLKKLTKKERKQKEKELKAQEAEKLKNKPLDAVELSKK